MLIKMYKLIKNKVFFLNTNKVFRGLGTILILIYYVKISLPGT